MVSLFQLLVITWENLSFKDWRSKNNFKKSMWLLFA